ncbi:uncharacterized protein FFB14_06431 [Fusarium fujikuroi]|nr:uncharacterized protein FFB14_06431 [Fusarium fujikuroi]
MSVCNLNLFYTLFRHLKSCFRASKMEASATPNYRQYHFSQQPARHSTYPVEPKNTRSIQWHLWPSIRVSAPLCGCDTPLSPKHDVGSPCWSTDDTEDGDEIEVFSSSEPNLVSSDYFQPLRLEIKMHTLAVFNDWKQKMEYITPPENGKPFQEHSEPSLEQSMVDIKIDEQFDTSDDELVVISRSARRFRASFHLACPFYVYDPEKCHQCLFTGDLRSISDVVEHLFQFHSRPCYCMNCYETFDTQIHRDDHVLHEKCQERTPGPLFGLAESLKAMLLEIDTRYSSERALWFDIWSIVFPDSWKPRSPYLDQGAGLGVSMMRDFWDLYGSRCISESLKVQGIPQCEGWGLTSALYGLVLQDLLNSA